MRNQSMIFQCPYCEVQGAAWELREHCEEKHSNRRWPAWLMSKEYQLNRMEEVNQPHPHANPEAN